jgi:hypothetical protein
VLELAADASELADWELDVAELLPGFPPDAAELPLLLLPQPTARTVPPTNTAMTTPRRTETTLDSPFECQNHGRVP